MYMGFQPPNSIISRDIKYHAPVNGGWYYRNELYFSKAYQELTNAGRDLLHCFIIERRWPKGKPNVINNNGNISFTEVQFREVFNYSKATYLKARNQLIKNGLIKQTKRGGNSRGDMAEYKILCLDGLNYEEQRWRQYPGKKWENEIPKPKKQLVGVKTQWKRGQCGRKSKATL